MNIAEILLQDFDAEISNTRRTLERVPDNKPEWTPHEKSMKVGKLAMHCATLSLLGYSILVDDGMDMADPKRPRASLVFESLDHCLQRLDESAAKCRVALTTASDEHLLKTWPISLGEQMISNVPRSTTYRLMFFNHLVHHTAQLGVYLRLNDIPVPSLYGPSADEQWAPK